MQKEKLGRAARKVPGALAAPFKAFGHWSLYLDKQRRRPEFKQVMNFLQHRLRLLISPLLKKHLLLTPWPVQCQSRDNATQVSMSVRLSLAG